MRSNVHVKEDVSFAKATEKSEISVKWKWTEFCLRNLRKKGSFIGPSYTL